MCVWEGGGGGGIFPQAGSSSSCNIIESPYWCYSGYSRLTGFDALLMDRVVYYKFTIIL